MIQAVDSNEGIELVPQGTHLYFMGYFGKEGVYGGRKNYITVARILITSVGELISFLRIESLNDWDRRQKIEKKIGELKFRFLELRPNSYLMDSVKEGGRQYQTKIGVQFPRIKGRRVACFDEVIKVPGHIFVKALKACLDYLSFPTVEWPKELSG